MIEPGSMWYCFPVFVTVMVALPSSSPTVSPPRGAE